MHAEEARVRCGKSGVVSIRAEPGRTCQDGGIVEQHPATEKAGLPAGHLLEERHMKSNSLLVTL